MSYLLKPFKESLQKPSSGFFSEEEKHDEQELWRGTVNGEKVALKKLYNLYADKLFNYGSQFTHDRELCVDIVHDVFLQIIQHGKKLGVPQSVKFYLMATYRRKLVKALNRNNKISYADEYDRKDGFNLAFDPNLVFLAESLSSERKRKIEAAMRQLCPRHREVITLHFFEGLPYEEMAEILNFSHVKSARNLLYKALKEIARILENKINQVHVYVIASLLVF